VERRLKSAGVTLNVVMQLPGTEAVKKAVEANLGIGFVSSFAVEREATLGDLRLIAIEGFQVSRHMELIYRNQKYFSPVAQRFRDFVGEFGQGVTPLSATATRSKGKGPRTK
jgi:DNA-binding transcriptional LysR family regulator